jgi:hypothetical protein
LSLVSYYLFNLSIGVPFSDPIADGPTIQESSFVALQNGIDIPACLAFVQEVYHTPIHPFFNQRLESAAYKFLSFSWAITIPSSTMASES